MQPFLLEFVNSKAFEVLLIGLVVVTALAAIGIVAGTVALGLRLRNNWRWWKGLDETVRPALTRRYFLSKAKTLAVLLLAFGTLELLFYSKQWLYERSPAKNFQQQQQSIRELVAGEYTLLDTLLPASVRAAQQGQDGWSLTDTKLPSATLVQLIIRRDDTFTYRSNLPADGTPDSDGTWQWLSLTGHPEISTSYGPIFYTKGGLLQSIWAVRENGKFIFFGTYTKNMHDVPFELKRKAAN